MSLNKTKLFSILVFCLFFAFSGFGQFRNWERFEIGGNYVMVTGQFNGVSSLFDGANNFMGDTTIKRSVTSQIGYGVTIGTCIPFIRIGHESIWAISLGFMANEVMWNDLNTVYNSSGVAVPNTTVGPINGTTMQFALPFGIEYKVGTDAIKSQRSTLGASFGAGLMPIMNSTTVNAINAYDEHGGVFYYGILPYAKAEVAVYAGLCVKLRAMFSYGDINYMHETSNVGKYTDGPMNISGSTNLVLTLIIMPWSAGWTEHSWYNTYDTYNPYDKLH